MSNNIVTLYSFFFYFYVFLQKMKYYLLKYFETLQNIKLYKITEYYESSNYGALCIIEF
ncbi:hypothetical protein RhiirB3_533700 [Rhizophagus irregularis]|nr:hypothetical protein RhiirB3_533700 [Rhizophagus irregularis]